MLPRRIAIALYAALIAVAASAPTQANAPFPALAKADQSGIACEDGSASVQGCGGGRCLYVEQRIGTRTAGPTFPTSCRQIAGLMRNPAA